MKLGSIICVAIFALAALLSVVQLWFAPMSAEVYIKLLISLGILFAVVLSITLVVREYVEEKKMKESGHIE